MRRLIMVLLAFGAIGGFVSGFAHLHPWHRYGHGYGGYDGSDFERHVADVCTQAAARTLGQKPGEKGAP